MLVISNHWPHLQGIGGTLKTIIIKKTQTPEKNCCKYPKILTIGFYDFKSNILEPSHELMALFILHKLILKTRMHSHPVGLDIYFVWSDPSSNSILHVCSSEGSGETERMRKLTRAFAGRICSKYHNLMSWLIVCPEDAG